MVTAHTHTCTHTNITHTKIYFKLCCQEYLTGGGDDGSQLAREPDRYVKSGRDVR